MKLGYIVAILFAGLFFAQSALATLYLYDVPNADNGGMGDRLDSISSSYNTSTNRFTWDVTFNSDSTGVDGFWLVVNNGPNPKTTNVNELAIMYGDLATGTLTTYVYNGLNSSNSWSTPGIFFADRYVFSVARWF